VVFRRQQRRVHLLRADDVDRLEMTENKQPGTDVMKKIFSPKN
jgi:hypothetical protein